MRRLRIAALEPYAALSHLAFLEGWRAHSRHAIELFTLPARAWKWRMRTASLHFAEVLQGERFDALFASDYVDLAELVAHLAPEHGRLPSVLYFHENQLTYPLQPGERVDHHFGLQHLHGMLVAGRVLFNSDYHRRSLFDALTALLRHAPDVDPAAWIARARERSEVLPLGTALPRGEPRSCGDEPPVVLWTHRWEYDKDPDAFVDALEELARRDVSFRVRVLGQRFRERPPAHARLHERLRDRIVEDRFVEDPAAYRRALESSHVFVSTARHEFFGLSTLEALRTGLHPVVPDDLAYPELFPEELSESARGWFLVPRGGDLAGALASALEATRSGERAEERLALVAHTDRFSWPTIAARLDRALEDAVEDAGRARGAWGRDPGDPGANAGPPGP